MMNGNGGNHYPNGNREDASYDEQTPLNGNHAQLKKAPGLYVQDKAKVKAKAKHFTSTEKRPLRKNSTNAHHLMYVPEKPKHPWKDKTNCALTIVASVLALVLCLVALLYDASPPSSSSSSSSSSNPALLFDDIGRYIFEDYDAQTPFSDFLPGLAGIYGKPLYAFFVNRGQGIATFGVESKDAPIMEFHSANKAYQNTPLLGFRTFLQGRRGNGRQGHFLIEPFSPLRTNYDTPNDNHNMHGELLFNSQSSLPKRIMYTGENEVQIQEIDWEHQLETNVTYFVLPEEDFGAFVRRTTVTNTHPKEAVTISLLDGLARIQPAGGKLDDYLKKMGRTLEGWMRVYFPHSDSITMPFFRLVTEPQDTASVKIQERGHYCLSLLEGTEPDTATRLLPIVYDTSKVFGEDTTLLRPMELHSKSIKDIVRNPQYGMARTSSCFAAVEELNLQPGETATIATFYGTAENILDVPVYARRLLQEGFVQYKLTRSREVIRQITKSVETKTANKLFDGHVQKMFLDNSLRGGIPLILGDTEDSDAILNVDEDPSLKVFHVFSRIHGDLERDYNDFMLSATFFSEGPGNFRDVAQNRRDDVVFNPRIGSFNVRTFLSFIQADGYEPLSVEAVVFTIRDQGVCNWIAERSVGRADGHRAQREALSSILHSGPFRPGQLFGLIKKQRIELKIPNQEFIDMVASAAESTPMAVFETGFWADHWTYYLDMVKSYLAIFPDREEHLLYDEQLPYFFSPASVQPRRKKYVLTLSYDSSHYHVMQLDATTHDSKKKKYMDQFLSSKTGWYRTIAHWQDDEKGKVFKSSIVAKLFLLATLKFATRDAYGMGIEYEGGRPGWDDANNGLSGMIGSGMPETFELKSLLDYLFSVSKRYPRPLVLPVELFELIDSIDGSLDSLANFSDPFPCTIEVPSELFDYWDQVATAREEYREKTRLRFSGETATMDVHVLKKKLARWLSEVERGIARSISLGTNGFEDDGNSGLSPTYFAYNVTAWKNTGEDSKDGHPLVVPLKMAVRTFPLFLEGPARMMKTSSTTTASEIYQRVRHSSLRDEGLSMYTLSGSLKGQPVDIGRSMAFPPGWLENQSVWLHMSYKFYLELLRHKLYDEYFAEMSDGGLLPFMDPDKYGRSLMECSSFIASSAFEDPSMRGRGFLARLSGSTAEFLSMWIILFIGPEPFYMDEDNGGELRMKLQPSLPMWLFKTVNEDGLPHAPTVSFKLFSSIHVHYYNEEHIDLFGASPHRYRIGLRDGSIFDIDEASVPFELADKIRRVVFVDFIEAYF